MTAAAAAEEAVGKDGSGGAPAWWKDGSGGDLLCSMLPPGGVAGHDEKPPAPGCCNCQQK